MDIQIIQSLDQSVVEEQLKKRRAVANAASTNAATDTTTTSAVQTSQQTQNFSQILETATKAAAALAIDAVLLTPACCDPLYRRAIRVSMGTVFQIPWTYIGDKSTDWATQGIKQLHDLGFQTAAMALCEDSVNIDDPKLMSEEKLAVILGTEGDGLAASTIADCDYTVCIPMSHGVDSLNVAAASAVAFWELSKRETV